MDTTFERVKEAAEVGAQALKHMLEGEELAPDVRAKVAAAVLSAYARLYQANSSREATSVQIMRLASEDSTAAQEFRRLVIETLPGAPVSAALAAAPVERSRADHSGAKPSSAKRRAAEQSIP